MFLHELSELILKGYFGHVYKKGNRYHLEKVINGEIIKPKMKGNYKSAYFTPIIGLSQNEIEIVIKRRFSLAWIENDDK